METIKSLKTISQISRTYDVHVITTHKWTRGFMEKGPEIFGQKRTIHEYEKEVWKLKRLIGHKDVKIALLENSLNGISSERINRACQMSYG